MKIRAYIDEHLLDCLKEIVEIYWEGERKHWDELENPGKHIYHSISYVRNYLISLKNKGYAIDMEEWEVVPDEELWEDGELSKAQVKRKIAHRVLNTGDWRLQRVKEDDAK